MASVPIRPVGVLYGTGPVLISGEYKLLLAPTVKSAEGPSERAYCLPPDYFLTTRAHTSTLITTKISTETIVTVMVMKKMTYYTTTLVTRCT